MSRPAPPPFVVSLEALRGVAAFGVALFHVTFTNPTRDLPWVRNAYLWVDVFFVLSGYVMAHAYGQRLATRRDALEYLWLRLGRIYPLHVVVTLAFLGIELARWASARGGHALETAPFSVNGPGALAANLLLVHAHGLTDALTFNGPSWSIGAEFWAYVGFAGLSLLGVRGSRRGALALVTAAALYGLLRWWHPSSLDLTFDGGVVRCLAGFSLGLASHAAATHPVAARVALPLGVVGAAGVLGVLGASKDGALDFALPWAGAVLLIGIAAAPTGVLARSLMARPLVWLGKVSFSVYMLHSLVLRAWTPVVKALGHGTVKDGVVEVSALAGTLGLAAYVAVLLAASSVSYRLIEEPARRWARQRVERLGA